MQEINTLENANPTNSNSSLNILTIEDHNEAYHIWHHLGFKDKILVHIDAHIDFAWFSEENPIALLQAQSINELKKLVRNTKVWNPSPSPQDTQPDIGNYIYPAIREGIIKTFYWVVPDDFLNTRKKLKFWRKRIRRIIREIPQYRAAVIIKNGCIITKFYDCDVMVCSLNSLPRIRGNVLLDIDTDFFVTDFEKEKSVALLQIKKCLPWLWPKELVRSIQEKVIEVNLVTIAYSVEKYFTPIEFKYLGDNLKILLSGINPDNDTVKVMEYQDNAMANKYNGLIDDAINYLQETIRLRPQEACNYYNLALIQYDKGLFDMARQSYQRAVNLDKSYRSRYNNLGEIYNRFSLNDKMEQEFKRLLILDPQNPHAHSGMGEVFLIKGILGEAKKEFEKALSLEADNHKARYLLSEIFIQEKKYPEAIILLNEVIDNCPGYLQAYLTLARLYVEQGMIEEAISNYKLALRLGFCDAELYLKLGLLFMKKGFFLKGLKSFIKAVSAWPSEVLISIKGNIERKRLLKRIFA